MPIRVGNIASGEDFFDRLTELDDLWRYLEGNNLVLTGPRRLGKSSLLKRFGEQAAEKGLYVQLIDVQGHDSAAAFIAELDAHFPQEGLVRHAKAAAERVTAWLKSLKRVDFNGPGGIGAALEMQNHAEAGWGASARQLQVRLVDQPALLLIDEFSVFLEKLLARDVREAEQLLGWLRAWRLADTTCRFVLSGSIGINALLERHRLTTWMNDCYEFELGPFRPGAAREMLVALAKREEWVMAAESAASLCAKTGWLSPFYLNLLLDEAMKAGRDRLLESDDTARELQTSDIDDGYERLLASRSRFVHWYQRLQRDLQEPQRGFVLAILRYLARAEAPLTRRQLSGRLARLEADPERRAERLADSLVYLQEHGYVGEAEGGQIAFLSFLLRDYWRRNHGD